MARGCLDVVVVAMAPLDSVEIHHGIYVDSAAAVVLVVALVVVVVVAAVAVVVVVAEASRAPLGVFDVDYCNVCCRHGFLH